MKIASVPRSTSRTWAGVSGHQPLGAGIAIELQHLRKIRRGHNTGLPRRPSCVGTTIRVSFCLGESLDQPVEMARLIRGMSPNQTSAPSARGHGSDPALSELLRPCRVIRIGDKRDIEPGQRRVYLARLMASHDQHRPSLACQAASTTRRTIALPSTSTSSLLAAPMRVERPAASTMAAMFVDLAIFSWVDPDTYWPPAIRMDLASMLTP